MKVDYWRPIVDTKETLIKAHQDYGKNDNFWKDLINQSKEYQDWFKRLAETQINTLQQQMKQQQELYQHYKGILPQYEKTIDTTQGLLSGIQNEYNQAIEDYKKGVQAAITGQVPPEMQQHLENLRQLYIQKGRQDLEHVYNELEHRYMDTLAGKGILQSKPAADIISKLREDEIRKIAEQINQANTLYEQGMLNEPYKVLNALGSEIPVIFSKTKIPQMKTLNMAAKFSPNKQMGNLLSASAQYPFAISNIGSSVVGLPEQSARIGATVANTYTNLLQPLLSWWNTREQIRLQNKQINSQDDVAMWSAFGQLVPFVFGGGLFG